MAFFDKWKNQAASAAANAGKQSAADIAGKTEKAGYGYGLGVRTLIAPTRGGSLSPVGEFGWDGAAGCYVLMDPENRLTLFYAQQMLPSMCEYTCPRLRNLLCGCL